MKSDLQKNNLPRLFNGRPLVLLALLFALGIGLGRLVFGPAWIYPLIFFFVCIISGIILLLSRISAWIPVFLASLFLGATLCSIAAFPDYNYIPEEGKSVRITGTVCELPYTYEGRTLLVLDEAHIAKDSGSIPLKGSVYLRTPAKRNYAYGDIVIGSVILKLPDKQTGFDIYLLARGVWYEAGGPAIVTGKKEGFDLYGLILSARQEMEKTIDKLYGNAAPVMKAMLIGNQDDVPEAGIIAFRNTGTAHILAVSGLNVGFIAAPLYFLFRRIIKTKAVVRFYIVSIILILYCILTGLSPPILRATIMAILILAGRSWGQKPDTPTALAASFLLILAINPMWLYDAGFQLSFSGVAGILLITPRIEHGLRKLPKWLVGVFAASVGGQAGTLPFTALHFNQIAVLGLLVNLVAVPLTGVITIAGFLSVLLGLIWQPLGIPFAFIAKGLLFAMLSAVAFGNTVPGVSVKTESPSIGYFVWYYACLLNLSPYLLVSRKTRTLAGAISGGITIALTLIYVALCYNEIIQHSM